MRRSLIVCIGNDLVADDGASRAVYDLLSGEALPAGAELRFVGLGGIDLLDQLDGEDLLLVVDTVQLGAAPGTVHCLPFDALPRQGERPVSGHGIGIREAIAVAARLYPERVPKTICLVGIEGACFDRLGGGLSTAVRAAVPVAVKRVKGLLAAEMAAPGRAGG